MILARRAPAGLRERLRVAVWPRRCWGRSARYGLLRLGRLQGSPHSIALGVAFGIFSAFVPVLGTQMLIAAALAVLSRASLVGALAGTCIGTPLTYPFMWLGSYSLGAWLLGIDGAQASEGYGHLASVLDGASADELARAGGLIWPLLKPLTLGGAVLGCLAGLLGYYIVRQLVAEAARRRIERAANA
jgi:hypothetical protein